ncbi:MAG: succinylglutamate desuccinylase/aspartoacylase family protein [Deltaproteobacteria bacterium]|nr:succinylglutamate desuccinylase/aspartoacylase family protein [Deltaproteobacteria bacterium]
MAERETAAALLDRVAAVVARRGDLVLTRRELHYRAGRWPLVRVASRALDETPRVLLVLAGLHGDEVAGPITVASELDHLAERAHARGLGVVVYPLANPSGFDAGTRYNADHDRGSAGNGDFLRYLREDGSVVDEVEPSPTPRAWRWSSELGVPLPAETRALHELLTRDPLERVVAALDLHQDLLTQGVGPAAYAYSFGDTSVYRDVVAQARALVPLLANRAIGAGFGVQIDERGRAVQPEGDAGAPTSDADGFVVRHDGSLTDLLYRLGAPYSVAVETTGATPLDVACAVNRVWLDGLLELAGSAAPRRA